LKVLLVNLLAALNFADVFLKIRKRKNVTKIKKCKKTFFTSMVLMCRFSRRIGGGRRQPGSGGAIGEDRRPHSALPGSGRQEHRTFPDPFHTSARLLPLRDRRLVQRLASEW